MALECNIKVLDESKTKLRPIELHSFGFSSNFENKEIKKNIVMKVETTEAAHIAKYIYFIMLAFLLRE